jgi:phosphonate transport system substrate-binding protein
MTDQAENLPSSGGHSSGGGSFGTGLRLILFLCLIGALLYAGNAAMQTLNARNSEKLTEDKTVQGFGLIAPEPKTLAGRFTDSQGRLLADPPAAADQLIEPDTIVVAHIEGTEDNPSIDWKKFEKYLAKMTGKKVTDQSYDNSADQLAEIDKNKITILALHAADTPFLVNNYGFQPVAVLGADSGANGNHLDLIVSASSPLAKPEDLRSHTMVCTVPASITGYRAAVALLLQNQGLRPNVDYILTWSMGQKRSIMGVIQNQYDAAAVSDDKVQSLLDDGDIQKSQFKVIYQSEVIPRTTIGWFYNLKPELADRIRTAILSFRPEGKVAAAAEDEDSADAAKNPAKMHFIPIDYKKDFQLVRTIDASFDPRLDAKTKAKDMASAAASTTNPSNP